MSFYLVLFDRIKSLISRCKYLTLEHFSSSLEFKNHFPFNSSVAPEINGASGPERNSRLLDYYYLQLYSKNKYFFRCV